MKLKVITGLVLTLFLIGILTMAFNIQPIKAATIIVSDHYPTIQQADITPPTIGIPCRIPVGDVLPDQPVKVSVNVTDVESGVKNVTLSYTINNGTTWEKLPMNYNSSTGLYEATIPGQPAGTWVKYKIIAYDNAENLAIMDGTEPYCMYHVIGLPPTPPTVGGTIVPINKLELLMPYIGIISLILAAITVIVKKRKIIH